MENLHRAAGPPAARFTYLTGSEVMAKTAKKTEAGTKKLPAKKVKKRRQVKKGPHGHTMVVLVNDLEHVGKQGDVVEVRPGYARNYLLPYGHAVIPTEENLRTLEQYKIKVQKAREARIADLKVLSEQLSRLPAVTIEANATEEGHLYGSIGPAEISKTLKGKNLMVEPDMVKLETHIKEANTLTEVPLNLGYGIEAKIQVLVVALQGAKK
jgi:large subunit ribosomal protein L9